MPSKITEVSSKLNALLSVPELSRDATEHQRFALFLQEVTSVIMSDPDVICYISSMYTQKARNCVPALRALGQDLAEAIVEKNSGSLSEQQYQQYYDRFFIKYSEYSENSRRAGICRNTEHTWVSTFRLGMTSVKNASDDPDVKVAVDCLLLTIPTMISGFTVVYPDEIQITATGSSGKVYMLGKEIDTSLFLNVGDILYGNCKVTKAGAFGFELNTEAEGSTSSVEMGYGSHPSMNIPRIRASGGRLLFSSLLKLGLDLTTSVRQGMLAYRIPVKETVFEYDESTFIFDGKSIEAYSKIKALCSKYNIVDALDMLVDASWHPSAVKYTVTDSMKNAASDAMLIANSGRV